MGPIVRKEFKQLFSDKAALLTILLMPLVLTLILGFSLANSMGSTVELDLSIAVVAEETLEKEAETSAESLGLPVDMLKETAVPDALFSWMSDELSIEYANSLEEVRQGNYAAVIEIPQGYREQMWEQQYTGESNGSKEFVLYRNTEEWVDSVIVESMIDSFMMQRTFQQAVGEPMPEIGEVVLKGDNPVSSFQYYTFGMGVMYVFFSAGFIATFAFHEKKTKVYSRLVLANISPSHYLIGKAVASMSVVLTQMCLLFGICFVLFQITIINWLGFLLIAICLSVAVAGISTLLISIQFRYHTEKAANIFMFSIISILAFLGGSFFRIADMAPSLAQIGHWTPNGRALSAFIQASQGELISVLLPSSMLLLGYGFAFLVIAWGMFPNKGGAAK